MYRPLRSGIISLPRYFKLVTDMCGSLTFNTNNFNEIHHGVNAGQCIKFIGSASDLYNSCDYQINSNLSPSLLINITLWQETIPFSIKLEYLTSLAHYSINIVSKSSVMLASFGGHP